MNSEPRSKKDAREPWAGRTPGAFPWRRPAVLVPAAGGAAFVLAFTVLAATGNAEVQMSADGYGTTPLWAVTLPVLAGLVLVRLIPPRTPPGMEAKVRAALSGRPLGAESAVLLGCLGLFLLANLLLPAPQNAEDPAGLLYPLSKLVLFLAVPLAALRLTRPRHRPEEPGLARISALPGELWRWGGLVAVAAVLYLGTFSPIAPPAPTAADLPPLPVLLIAMTATFLTASVLEEIFFRVWLQTRLEVRFGRWAGIVLASLAFGAMHLASHRAFGHAGLDLASVIAVQGTAGLLYGYLWARYRNVWLIILLHTGVNSLALVPVLLSG